MRNLVIGLLFVSILTVHSKCYASDEDFAEVLERAILESSECDRLFHEYALSEALDCFNDIYQKSEHPLVASVARQGTSYTLQRMGDSQKALSDMQEAIHLAHPYEEAVLYMARLLAGYSRLLMFHEQYDLAERYLRNARNYYESYIRVVESDHNQTGFLVYQVSATLFFEIGRLGEARNYALQALGEAAEIPSMEPATSYLLLARIEHSDRKSDAALDFAWKACGSDGDDPAVVKACILAARLSKDENQMHCANWALTKAREKLQFIQGEKDELAMEIEHVANEIAGVK